VRDKNNSSMAVGLKMLAEGEGDAFVSAGNTGALHAGSTLIVRRIKGVKKSGIATIMPYGRPTLMVDCGANTELTAQSYLQFAQMGTIYMRNIFGIPSPEVGLLNIGSERTKGPKELVEVYDMLERDASINFKGNVEGKELPYGVCDVLVTDGFTGNIVLKLTEGCGGYIMQRMKGVFYKNMLTKASAMFVKSGMKELKNDFSASEYGGAPLLGLSKPVIKAHGSSDAMAVKNAVRQAINYINTGIIYEIARVTAGDELGE
jgi:fatty acid/phospholipid synthesis protein PlsX